MKHNITVISWMACFFLLAQFIGLAVLYQYIDVESSMRTGKTQFRNLELAGLPLERPQVQERFSYAYIMGAVLIGTALMLMLIKWPVPWLWKLWFASAIIVCLSLALAAFIPSTIALAIAAMVAVVKVFRPNWWVQTFTELFMYAGLAVIFVPIMNLSSAVILLFLISLYDAYAVWHSRHMIALAQFQAKEQMFAGLVVPYEGARVKTTLPPSIVHARQEGHAVRKNPSRIRTAILGGGDIGFPLMFTGVVLKSWGLVPAGIIPLFATAALVILFVKGQDGKFYPAMPILSLGCLVGLAVARVLL